MPVKFNEEDTSEWSSDNMKTLAVDSSGFSVAMAPSEVFVTFSNNKFKTSTTINILPIKTVKNYCYFYYSIYVLIVFILTDSTFTF